MVGSKSLVLQFDIVVNTVSKNFKFYYTCNKPISHLSLPFSCLLNLIRYKNRWGRQFSQLLAVEVCGAAGSDCIAFSKYADHSLKMSLQGGKKRVKRRGEREIVYHVH